jgi:hypothetical protein
MSSNSSFDVTASIANFSQSCTYTDFHTSTGEYSYNFACTPSNATSSSQAQCVKVSTDLMNSTTFNCDYFFGGAWRNASDYQGMSCAGNCDAPPETKAIGAGVNTNPNLALTFIALFMVMFMVFNRSH